MKVVILALEELPGEFRSDTGVVVLAREDVQIHRVGLVGEVSRDERRLDKLRHRISGYPLIVTEIDDKAFPESLHPDELAELDYKPFNRIRVADHFGIASVYVNSRV